MAAKRDYYEVLGVDRSASDKQIADAYRKLAIRYHPDKNPGDQDAVTRFKEAAEAFEILADSEKRQRYDRFGHAGVEGMAGGAPHFADLDDIFQAFGHIFGGGTFGDLFGGSRNRRRVRRGADVRCNLTLDLMEASKGVTKTVEFERHERCTACEGSGQEPGTHPETCKYCGGAGQVIQSSGMIRIQTTCPSCRGRGSVNRDPCHACRGEGYELTHIVREIHVPAGIDDNMQLRLEGEGEPSPNGGPRGDCFCFVNVKPHSLFERNGRNLICRVPITYTQAALGADIEVPTLAGPEHLTLPTGTQEGAVFKLRGRGMPDPRRGGVGDLLVHVHVEVPRKLTPRQEELLRDLAEEEHANVSPHRKSFFEKVRELFVASEEPESRS